MHGYDLECYNPKLQESQGMHLHYVLLTANEAVKLYKRKNSWHCIYNIIKITNDYMELIRHHFKRITAMVSFFCLLNGTSRNSVNVVFDTH